MNDLLSPLGFNVITAENSREALALAEQRPPDMFMLDVAMPGGSGWELLQTLRATQFHQPVLMISAEAEDGKCQPAEGTGDVRFLGKPVRVAQLLENIGEMLGVEWNTEGTEVAPALAEIQPNPPDLQPLEKLKEAARLGYARGFKDLLAAYIATHPLSDEEGAVLAELAQRFRFDEVIAQLERTGVAPHDTE